MTPSRFIRRMAGTMDIRQRDDGFTLIELLIVLVVLPMIMGAIAVVMITAFNSDARTSARMSDSVNAQLTSAYFARDVAGASEVTTNADLTHLTVVGGTAYGFSAGSPQACGPSTILAATSIPSGYQFLIGLYHPASPAPHALDVSYWLVGTGTSEQLIRYSCSVYAATDPSPFTAYAPEAVVIADSATNANSPGQALSPNAITARVDISPSQFVSAASGGWTPALATTAVASSVSSMSTSVPFNLNVYGTGAGFVIPGTVQVSTPTGSVAVTCTGTVSTEAASGLTDFTHCTSASSAPAEIGRQISQSAISGVTVAVSEPGSNYRYSLAGAPRASQTAAGGGPGGGPGGGASLLTLGSGGLTKDGNSGSIKIAGSVVVDGGVMDCNGGLQIQATGTLGQVNPGQNGCPGAASGVPVVPDPLASLLPPCFPAQPAPAGTPSSGIHKGDLQPGVYTSTLTGTLAPGVYELAAGASLDSVTVDQTADYAGQGVLIYLAGPGSVCGDTSVTAANTPSIDLHGSIQLAPLTSDQASAAFGGNTALADTFMWQDALNAQSATMRGGSVISSEGLGYLPAAYFTDNGTGNINAGRLYFSGVTGNGSVTITLDGS